MTSRRVILVCPPPRPNAILPGDMTFALRARVKGGRLVLDEPVDLPEGSEVDLVPLDEDELDEDDRARLHAALEESARQFKSGEFITADESLARLHVLKGE